ncbi:phosphotransferase [Actinoplanes sp. NPDC051411]|uniref:phosphotransferase family protein n=1 Tax=Actinoplanes sp. NPDC051411 TaxID=3155522 RepID=UPI0034225E04
MRTVTLVLVDPSGEVLGELPPFEVTTPWWQEVGEIASRTGVQVLRLLHADRPAPPGGHVTYLAEVSGPIPGALQALTLAYPASAGLAPAAARDDSPGSAQPHRAAYAAVGGPAATLAWAARHIDYAAARQQRTWNLSAIWRLDDAGGEPVAWIKQVPSFFVHEAEALPMVDSVAPGLVPPLLAAGTHGRMLLGHRPGEDGYGAGAEVCDRIAAAFHPVQEHFAGRVPVVVPDRRGIDLTFARAFEERIPGLGKLLDDVPRRLAEVAACGLPDTLVHGDLHPGNVRIGPDARLTIMDWGDCYAGHPALDILRLTERLEDAEAVLRQWAYRWELSVPGSEPRRAAELMRPMAALWAAETYARFLAAIEPAEHPYHAADVPERLAAAVDAAQT